MTDELVKRANRIKLLGCDVDGVLTDGRIYLGDGKEIFKVFYAQDGLAMLRAERVGLKLAFITGRDSPIVMRRARELKVREIHLGIKDKLTCMKDIWNRTGIMPQETAFVGDDINDLPLMQAVGLACTVPGGAPEVKEKAHFIAKQPAGRGAVREIIEFILRTQKKWQQVVSRQKSGECSQAD